MKVTGRKASLINKACRINNQIKELEAQLKAIKKELDIDKPGTYMADEGVLVVKSAKKYAPIDPETFYNRLKAEGRINHFFECIKVQVTATKKIMDISSLQEVIGETLKWSWNC